MKKLLKISSLLTIIVGIIMIFSGAWGISFTYRSVAQEKIITPDDASIPGVPVSGLRTLKAQADIIREHMLKMTGDKTYAEMPRQIEKLDSAGKPVLGQDGKPVMVANATRDIWVTATTLRTALSLAILTYVFSGFLLLVGLFFICMGVVFFSLSKKH